MFDLASLAQSDSGILHLRDPTTTELLYHEDKRPLTITLCSPDSQLFKQRQRDRANAAMDQQRNVFPTAEDAEREATNILVDGTIAWTIGVDGKEPPCTEQEARKLYDDSRLGWVRDAVNRYMGRRANFIVGRARS